MKLPQEFFSFDDANFKYLVSRSIMALAGLFVSTSPRTPGEEVRSLYRRLNMEVSPKPASDLDAIYVHEKTGAKLFIGNQKAARCEATLVNEQIFHIVNCQDATAVNFFAGDPRFCYKRFPVESWWQARDVDTHAGILAFFEALHSWIDQALANGNNVLVHCLMGAHRAGTAGVSFMMRQGGFDVQTAIRLVKWQRTIVDPFGHFLDALLRLQQAYEHRGDTLLSAANLTSPRSAESTGAAFFPPHFKNSS